MSQSAKVLYEFGPFRLDPSHEELVEGTRKVPLTPKAYQTLLVLVENRGRTLSKDELLQKVWPDAFVEEATLAQNIFTLRKQLRDDRETAQYIDTVPKKGYRFVAEVREVQTSSPPVEPPPRMPRRKLAYAAVVAVVLATIVGGWYWSRREPPSERPTRETQPRLRTLAVLPLRGLSDNGGEESWGIGMTDAIITRLTSLQNLAVRPTASVLKYAKNPVDPTQAAQELGVESVLDGTYQRAGDRIRITVQLIERTNQATRWAEHYDLKSNDLLTFQDEVAQKVVDGLRVEVSRQERDLLESPSTKSAEAFSLYLQGRVYKNEYFIRSQRDSLLRGQEALRRAVEADPSFVDGHALLAMMYLLECANFRENAAAILLQGEKTARRAVELNPNSVEALLALGFALGQGGKNEEAIPRLRQAVIRAPNSEFAWDLLGYVYHYAGLDDLAERAYRRSLELDPTTPRIYWMHSRMLLYVGKVQEAEQGIRQALAIHPDQFKAMAFLGEFLYYQGKLDEAEPILRRAVELGRSSGDEVPPLLAAYLYASRGQRDKIDPSIFQEKPEDVADGDAAYWIGSVYALLGEKAQALVWLRRTIQLGNHNYPWFVRDKNFDKLRGDRDYEQMLAEIRNYADKYRQEFGASSF
ncbi:MAG TPA: winged helix-turn-helix domain-containing protein [Candidatus Angelobacter sp.]|nr:winged helix-turn-helix domain-containing protein [Candidatus Angelobacter sp.]